MQTPQFGTTIGTYGKGVLGSATVNFSPSGSKHCSSTCSLMRAGLCYATATEKHKPSVTFNLERKATSPESYLNALSTPKALAELASAPWVRFSAFGSIYKVSHWTAAMRSALTRIATALPAGRYHFPVETLGKARALRTLGFDAIRVSAGLNHKRLPAILANGFSASLSVHGPKRAIGKNKRQHSQPAFDKAASLRSKGITAIVCPALASTAKCGRCTACADNRVSVVVYPVH